MSYLPIESESVGLSKREQAFVNLKLLLKYPSKTDKFLGLGYSFLVLLILTAIISPYITTPHFLSPQSPLINPKTGQMNLIEADLINTEWGPKVKNNFILLPAGSVPEKITDREAKLTAYFEKIEAEKKINSPLKDYVRLIIAEADEHGISYLDLISIAMAESTLGINCPKESHNAWGVTVNGREGTIRYFDSWADGIKFESALLGTSYLEAKNNGIRQKYCPTVNCAKTWVSTVSNTAREINNINAIDLAVSK